MRRQLRLTRDEVEQLLKNWALEFEYLDANELAVNFRVTDGTVTSVEMTSEEDVKPTE